MTDFEIVMIVLLLLLFGITLLDLLIGGRRRFRMAEGPKITRNDDGLYVRCEFDAHYISDEDAKRIRGYIDQLEAENAKLRELVQDIYGVMWACAEQRCTHRHDGCFRVHGNHGDICVSERCWYEDRMSELGIEVE